MGVQSGTGFVLCFTGICVLLPYNCLLNSQPYLNNYVFANRGFPFSSMVSYSITLCLMQVIMTFVADIFSVKNRMLFAFVFHTVTCVVILLIPYAVDGLGDTDVLYTTSLLIVAVLASLNSVMQGTLMGLAGCIAPEAESADPSGAAMLGFGVSGLCSLFIALAVQGLDFAAKDTVKEQVGLAVHVTLFGICVVQAVLAGYFFHLQLCRHNPHVGRALAAMEDQRRRRHTVDNENAGCSLASRDAGNADLATATETVGTSRARRTLTVVRQVAPQALNVFAVFAVSLTVFPGVCLAWKPGPHSWFRNSQELFGTLLIGCFQVFDCVGRWTGGSSWGAKRMPPGRLWMFVMLRLLFIPIFMLGQRKPLMSVVWGSDVGRLLLMCALAFTNGFCATCAMIFGPERCACERRQTAGIAMSSSMVTGIFTGTLLALTTQVGVKAS
eukprot:gnl/TRDRNA2_/TRDRNA2_34086_c0_seq1.p1 gnl/TRDRNA2_/TRDRNA2_34086_c0~~gnl/TRDRNA2_/TRDRNA2_34086_c0_seq1.p1  ORF type:complete len:441 (-),score=67.39 gnl/TRDRNA2_/TRDRNA2_34086_c0_seq1:68-1390(-)